jgi:hypothetical protein
LALGEKSVVNNHTDMYEDGYYNTAVLEEMPWGPLAVAKAEHWYSVTPIVDGKKLIGYDVRSTEKPEGLAGLVSFGMG